MNGFQMQVLSFVVSFGTIKLLFLDRGQSIRFDLTSLAAVKAAHPTMLVPLMNDIPSAPNKSNYAMPQTSAHQTCPLLPLAIHHPSPSSIRYPLCLAHSNLSICDELLFVLLSLICMLQYTLPFHLPQVHVRQVPPHNAP
jgi:hypothetical protein